MDVIPSESDCPEERGDEGRDPYSLERGLAVGTMKIPRLRRFAASLGMTTWIACVHTVTRYYLPDAHNPRFDADAATQVLEQYVRLRCPDRLAAKKSESGDVRLTITADTSGAVTRAELVSSSGDDMLDGLFGTVTAQLKVDSLRATTKATATRRVRIAFSCAPSATVATLEMLRR